MYFFPCELSNYHSICSLTQEGITRIMSDMQYVSILILQHIHVLFVVVLGIPDMDLSIGMSKQMIEMTLKSTKMWTLQILMTVCHCSHNNLLYMTEESVNEDQ